MAVDVDDVSACPLAARCEACGAAADLDAATVGTPVGVYCATLCGPCFDKGRGPRRLGWGATTERVLAHCGHLGIDVEQMTAATGASR